MDMTFEHFGFFAFSAVGIYFAYSFVKYRSFKGAMFRATLIQTEGEVSGTRPTLYRKIIKVYELESDAGEPLVGIEIVGKAFAGIQAEYVTLDPSAAKHLAHLLSRASDN